MSRVMKKLKRKDGFTLGEVLIVALILLLLTAIVTAGLPAAQRAYTEVIDSGNAEVLLSTTLTVMQSELSTATDVRTEGGRVVSYKSGNSGLWSAFASDDGSESGIRLLEYAGDPESTAVTPKDKLIVSRKAATAPLFTVFDRIEYSGGVFTIYGLTVKRGTQDMTPEFGNYKVIALNRIGS